MTAMSIRRGTDPYHSCGAVITEGGSGKGICSDTGKGFVLFFCPCGSGSEAIGDALGDAVGGHDQAVT